MKQNLFSKGQSIFEPHSLRFFLSARNTHYNSLILFTVAFCMFGCASPQMKAWNEYEQGMLLVYKGYDPAQDKEDKVEKSFNKAIEYNENLPGVHASLGTYKAKKGDADAAKVLWREEIKLHPQAKKAMEIVLAEKSKENAKKEPISFEEQKTIEVEKEVKKLEFKSEAGEVPVPAGEAKK